MTGNKYEKGAVRDSSVNLEINGAVIMVNYTPGRLRPKLGLLGPSLTYTDIAASLMLGDQRHTTTEEEFLSNNSEVVRRVESGEIDLAVVAIENSTEGDVTEPLRLLVRARNTRILGEYIMPIQHMLIGEPDQEIQRILSHPQALAQSGQYLHSNHPNARLEPRGSTAQAVEEIIGIPNAAAIAGKEVARKYGLPIIQANIGDNPRNSTRFLLLGRGETRSTGNDATTMVFVTREDRPGILRDCLTIFYDQGVNLTKIDSYPHPTGQIKKYMFLVSHDGHEKDPNVASAHIQLQGDLSTSLKVLGSYKKADIPEGAIEPGAINGNGH